MRRGPYQKGPQPIYVSASLGSFNILDFNDKEWQYTFFNVPGHPRIAFVVPDELDYEDPADLAVELKRIIDHYLINSSKAKINDLVTLLDTDECREEQEGLRMEKERIKLETRLFEIYQCRY